MKKFMFLLTVAAAGLLVTFPTVTKAQRISYTPLYNVSEKIGYIPMMTSQGPVKNPNQIIDPSINYNERREKPYPGGEMWNGHMKNWPKKKTNKREM